MIIKNAEVYQPDFTFRRGGVYVSGDKFADAPTADGGVIDAEGCYLIPGLIDIHIHGAMGRDFSDGDEAAIGAMADFLASKGVTAFNPASMTLPEERLLKIAAAARAHENVRGAILTGITMEGPFFNVCKKGAQNADFLRAPDIGFFDRFNAASGGMVRVACVAPELDGASAFIGHASKVCSVSVGHTEADYDVATHAFGLGARLVTHTFNAMPPFSHRAPGLVGAAADSGAYCELICDGVHVHPSMIRAAVKLFGADRVVLVSDSMMAAGLSDGEYSLGGQAVIVKDGKATLADGTIAGGVSNVMDCLRNAVRFGIPLQSAIRMAAANPAEVIGVYDRMGSIEAGKLANFVLLDPDLNVKSVIIAGRGIPLPTNP
ncbi:N-acetylglucosamine-6-phosphate deacetylase [Clostridia bacterium]|nr:N-acetylglucosamine-6-phosphate deacetylase [Clostridia bacterium]